MSGLVSTMENACPAFSMQWDVRWIVEIYLTGEKQRIIIVRIVERLLFACVRSFFVDSKRVPCVLHAVRGALKRRNISNGREITHNCHQNRWIIAIFVCFGSFRRWKTRALRSARIMQWKERLNDETSQTGEKLRIIVVKIDELLLSSCVWACFDAGKRVHYVLHA